MSKNKFSIFTVTLHVPKALSGHFSGKLKGLKVFRSHWCRGWNSKRLPPGCHTICSWTVILEDDDDDGDYYVGDTLNSNEDSSVLALRRNNTDFQEHNNWKCIYSLVQWRISILTLSILNV